MKRIKLLGEKDNPKKVRGLKRVIKKLVPFFLVIAILFLLAKNLFSWLNVFFLVVGLSILEFFLISYQKPNFGPPDKGDLPR